MKALIFIIASLLFFACDNNKHAAVFTETESGKSISGIVIDSTGKALKSARVLLVDTNYIAYRNQPKAQTISDSNGNFAFENIPPGAYNLLQIDTLKGTAGILRILLVQEEQDKDTIRSAFMQQVFLSLTDLGFTLADTLCVAGSMACLIISNENIQLDNIGVFLPRSFANPVVWLLDHEDKTPVQIPLQGSLSSSEVYMTDSNRILTPKIRVDFALPDSISQQFNKDVIPAIPLAFWLPNQYKASVLIDQKGNFIRLDSAYAQGDSTLFWGEPIDVDFQGHSTARFWAFDPINPVKQTQADSSIRVSLHFDSASDSAGIFGKALWFDTDSSVYSIPLTNALSANQSIGVSLWIKMDGAIQPNAKTPIFKSFATDNGITLQQGTQSNTAELRIDTKNGESNAIFGNTPILDGKWHHYAFTINADKLQIVVDGNVIADTTFDLGAGFDNLSNPTLGDNSAMIGSIDEFMILDGSQNIQWLRFLYELQRPFSGHWDRDIL